MGFLYDKKETEAEFNNSLSMVYQYSDWNAVLAEIER